MNFLCKIGLHWPLNRKRKAFTDRISCKPVYLCQCPCNKWWLAEGRYKIFKIVVKNPMAYLTAIFPSEKL